MKNQAIYYILVLFIAGGICFAVGISVVVCFGFSMVKINREVRKRMVKQEKRTIELSV